LAAVAITFPGNLAQVDTAADLRSVPSSLIAEGELYLVGALNGVFRFEPSSVAIDDGQTVLRPDDRTPLQAGRWIKQLEGFAPGPPGPANSTFVSLPALKAAPASNGSYILLTPSGPVTYAYVAGDFTGQADDTRVVKLDAVALAVGALVRQDATGITARRSMTAAAYRVLADKVADRFDTRDILGWRAGTDEDMSGEWQAGIDAAASERVPLYMAPGRTFANQLILRNGTVIRGNGPSCSFITHNGGNNSFVFGIDEGVTQDVELSDFQLFSSGGQFETGLYFYAQPQATAPYHGGLWNSRFTRLRITDFGNCCWLRGGSDQSSPQNPQLFYQLFNQFLAFRDVKFLRSLNNIYSRSLVGTGNVGQISFEGTCHFDPLGEGSTVGYAPGFNVNFSSEWRHTDGRIADAASAYMEGFTGWSPAGPSAPYAIVFDATSQGSDYALMIDGPAEIGIGGAATYFENVERVRTIRRGARVRDVGPIIYRNCGGSVKSAGGGYLTSNDLAFVGYGNDSITGDFIDRTHIVPTGTVPFAYDRVGPTFTRRDLSSLESNTTPFLGLVGDTVPLNSLTAAVINAGSVASPAVVKNIGRTDEGGTQPTSTHAPQTEIVLTTHIGCSLRFEAGGNITPPGAQPYTIGELVSVKLRLRDFDGQWGIIGE
jgi:hypothetical protein